MDREAISHSEEGVCLAGGVEVLWEFLGVLAIADEPRDEVMELGIGVVQDVGQFLAGRCLSDEGQPDVRLRLRFLIQQGEFGQGV